MAKVNFFSKEFDVDSEEMNANNCGAAASDYAAFAARMKSGEIRRLKTLLLVSLFSMSFVCHYVSKIFTSDPHHFTAPQRLPLTQNRRRRCPGDCRRDAHEQQCAAAGTCAYVLHF